MMIAIEVFSSAATVITIFSAGVAVGRFLERKNDRQQLATYTYARDEIKKARAAFEGLFEDPEEVVTPCNTKSVDFSAIKKSKKSQPERICNI